MGIESVAVIGVLVCSSVILMILFGPSLYSSYENWKVKKGIR